VIVLVLYSVFLNKTEIPLNSVTLWGIGNLEAL
jgi:hypothetical protein